MENKFMVQNVFYLDSNTELIIEGTIIQGIIKQGMMILIDGENYLCSYVDYAYKSDNTSSNIIRIPVNDKSKVKSVINYLNNNPVLTFR